MPIYIFFLQNEYKNQEALKESLKSKSLENYTVLLGNGAIFWYDEIFLEVSRYQNDGLLWM